MTHIPHSEYILKKQEIHMSIRKKHAVSVLLLLSFLLLLILVPGGPIETRKFSHIDPLILVTFNTFLTSLGIVSLLLAYFVLKGRRWTFTVSALCGILYFLVYAFDLGKIFPVSPDPMSQTLLLVEILGVIFSFPLIYIAIREVFTNTNTREVFSIQEEALSKGFAFLLLLLVVVGIGVVVFATKSAMGR